MRKHPATKAALAGALSALGGMGDAFTACPFSWNNAARAVALW
jgi:hypothetical protein